MAYHELLQSMELSADEKVENLLDSARKSSGSIQEEAQKEAGVIRKKLVTEAEEELQRERNHALYLLREELKADMTREKQALYDRSFERAGNLLKSCRVDPRYKDSFSKLMHDSVDGIPGTQVFVHLDPEDSTLMSGLSVPYGSRLILMPDLDCLGGLIATTPDERITIRNTIESRLENAREALKKEIYSLLFG
jgi:V/A-type H+-transporting ATPase subunit E